MGQTGGTSVIVLNLSACVNFTTCCIGYVLPQGPVLRFKGDCCTVLVEGGPQLLEVPHSAGLTAYVAALEWPAAMEVQPSNHDHVSCLHHLTPVPTF